MFTFNKKLILNEQNKAFLMSSTNEIVAKFNPILFIIDTPICILTEKIIKALLVYIVNLFL